MNIFNKCPLQLLSFHVKLCLKKEKQNKNRNKKMPLVTQATFTRFHAKLKMYENTSYAKKA